MNSPSASLRTLAAKGLVPLSLVAALVTGNPTVSAQETTSSYGEDYSFSQEEKPQHKKSSYSFGAKLFTPSSFDGHAGMWVGRNLSTTSSGDMNIPQLHEYFVSNEGVLYKTTITSGKNTIDEKHTSVLPEKVAQSLREKMPSMPAELVFQHFS